MSLSGIRGAILEEIVLHLLEMVGYRIVQPGEEGTQAGKAGLEVCGRGEWHQIDGLAAFDHTPAFMYPLRLLVEAKCYALKNTVGIEIVRNSVGVLKDINENYFTLGSAQNNIKIPRFNYNSAIFSTSGYTKNAQRYALAHQIFLIQYDNIHWLKPIIDALLKIDESYLIAKSSSDKKIHLMRMQIRQYFHPELFIPDFENQFSAKGIEFIEGEILTNVYNIRGSYFGMLQGKWPVHLISNRPIPPEAFAERDEILCKIYGRESGTWSFVPVEFEEADPRWFRLEFDLPEEIFNLVKQARKDALKIAHIKQAHFSYLDLAGKIGGQRRQVRLTLDPQWIEDYKAAKIRQLRNLNR